MFIVDAFLQVFDFVRSLLFAGQVTQDNTPPQATIARWQGASSR